MISNAHRDHEDSHERLLRLAMDVSDGKVVDWDSEKHAYPELRETLKHGQDVASIANVCGLPTNSAENAGTSQINYELPMPEKQHPKTWGHLRDLQFIAAGTFGDVYSAHDTRLEIDVALKLLREGHDIDCPEFLDEARRLAKVRHDNIVTVHGADEHDGRIGLWTDLLVGQTLEEQLAETGTMSSCEAISTGLDLCRALAEVHRVGLIHNDVKTNNVMRLTDNGRHVLMDFGCVREQLSDQDFAEDLVGTPVYMSPERLLHQKPATRASDIYALGVVLYRLVTHEYPVDGANVGEIFSKHSHRKSVRLLDRRPDLEKGFVEVVERALEHDPEQRFQTAGEIERALRDALSTDTQPPGPKKWMAVVAAVATAAILAAIFWLKPWLPDPPPELDVALYLRDAGELHDGAVLHPGAQVMMQVKGEQDTYLYVLNAAELEAGEVNVLFPTDLALGNPLPGSAMHQLPGNKDDRQAYWNFSSPGGKETILLIAAHQPLKELDSRLAEFNQIIFHPEISHINPAPEAQDKQRGIGGLSLGEKDISVDVLEQLESELKTAHGDRVLIWRMQLQCVPEDTGAGDSSTSGELSSSKPGDR